MPGSDMKKRADELLKQAYEQYYISVYKFCLSKLKNDTSSVEDCTQEAFIVLYKKYLSGENVEFVQAFLLKTASNFIKKQYVQIERAAKTVDLQEVIYIPSQDEDIDDRLTFEEYSRQISSALSDLDADLFSMRYVEDLQIDEIALRMDMSVSSVTTRLSRLRNKLRKILTELYQ